MRIGILGGTFNPIHSGHLILAEEVREKLKLDRVVFVPANIPPHKRSATIAPARKRLEMLRIAVKGNRAFAVSDVELRRAGPSYTIDTLYEFKKQYPGDELYFITGSDLLKYLAEWKDLRQVLRLVKFIVATRPGYPLEGIPRYIATVPIRAVDISAFEVRLHVRMGKSFRYLVPEGVYQYIQKHRLYRSYEKK